MDWTSKRNFKDKNNILYEYYPNQGFTFSIIKKINENTTQFNMILFYSDNINKYNNKNEYIKFLSSYIDNYLTNLSKKYNKKEDGNFKIKDYENELKNDNRGKFLLDIPFENY
jgi:hypothetical protein